MHAKDCMSFYLGGKRRFIPNLLTCPSLCRKTEEIEDSKHYLLYCIASVVRTEEGKTAIII